MDCECSSVSLKRHKEGSKTLTGYLLGETCLQNDSAGAERVGLPHKIINWFGARPARRSA